MSRISQLHGLGPKSAEMLSAVGITTADELTQVGPLKAYLMVRDNTEFKPGLNLLYAMVGALENRHWSDIARNERLSLLLALDDQERLQALLDEDHS